MTNTEKLVDIANAVIDSVKMSGKTGMPGGTLYAALMPVGCTLEQFDQFMSMLVASGRIEKCACGQQYFVR